MSRTLAAVLACALTSSVALGAPPAGDADGTAAITFTGFDEHTDGSSRLYVKLSHPVSVEPTITGTHLEYVLVGTRIPIRNNKNPLITSHFGSQVVSARLVLEDHGKTSKGKKRVKAKVAPLVADAARLVVETREAVTPQHRMVRNSDGTAMLVIDFAKPSKTPPPEPDVIAPPAATKSSQSASVD
ncbi:MAG TPA: hypothetical protein VH062_31755 [Polyangiaceae bacterium]|nr:hypothetical protein [Polyangiaceae bacterium]